MREIRQMLSLWFPKSRTLPVESAERAIKLLEKRDQDLAERVEALTHQAAVLQRSKTEE